MKTIVTIGREYGSGGRLIAQKVADLLQVPFYDKELIETADLCIPHPEISLRRFVLEPLAELEPNLHHPCSGLTVRQMLQALDNSCAE